MSRSRAALGRALCVFTFVALFAVPFAPTVSADARCGGSAGVQVWENDNLSGRSWIICSFPEQSLHDDNDNLFVWESWGDRITSFQTFNMSSTRDTCFWHDVTYVGTKYRVVGNKTVLNVGSAHNDKFSSLKSQASC